MRKRKDLLPLLVVGGLLLILAAACFFTQNLPNLSSALPPTLTFTSQPTPLPTAQAGAGSPTALPPAPEVIDPSAHPEIKRVPLEQAKAAFDSKSAVFIDVRGEAAFTISHIPGALDLPLAQIESNLNGLDSNQWIIPYCT